MRILFIYFLSLAITQAAPASTREPNDNCFDSCDSLGRMCIMFCQLAADGDMELYNCIKRCSDLRFFCRLTCEIDFDENRAGAPPIDTTILASSSKNIKIKILDRNAVKKKREREENYNGCKHYCLEVDRHCIVGVCHLFLRGGFNCTFMCGLGLKECLYQCSSAYGDN